MPSLLHSLIVRAHLIDLNMAGIKQYLCFVVRCILQWRTPRPIWNPAGITSSPPTSYIVLSTPNMDSAHTTFPTHTAYVLPTTSQQRQFCTSTTPSHTEIAETYVIPGGKLCHQWRLHLKSHLWTNGNLTSTSMTPTRSMGWIPFQNPQSDFLATKTLKVWILCKSHSGSSCTKAYTTHGSAVLHTAEKPSSFLSTT